jgi:hypothetical protein
MVSVKIKPHQMNGIIAIGFLGISVVLLVSTVYLNTTSVNIYIYLYWFLAGYLVNLYYFKTSPQKDTVRNQSTVL